MSRQNYLNLILLFLLLAQRVSAQVANLPKDRIVLLADEDSSYQKIGVKNNLPTFYPAVKERLTFPLSWLTGSFNDFNIWREEARKTVKQLFLAKPPEAPFNPVIIDRQDRGTYVTNKIVTNISCYSRVLGYLLIPKGTGPFPAVLLLHDHGAKFDIGKEKVVRSFNDTLERMASAEAWVNKIYGGRFIGDELAKRGYVCFVTDALNWGDRGGAGYEGQQALASNLFNLGMSYAGLIAWEDINAAHFLATLPEVDPERVATVGLSLGAFRAWQVAAMSDDIKAAVCICWMATIKGLMTDGNNQTRGQSAFAMTHPGLFNFLDYPDVASIACPKPMLFYNGELDHLFPVSAVKEAYEKMRTVWISQRAGERLVTQFWHSGHEFSVEMQEAAFHWLDVQMVALKDQIK
jgi:dienelactone hydrolase